MNRQRQRIQRALVLTGALAGCHDARVVTVDEPVRERAIVQPPAARVTAMVCIHCTGVQAIDPAGRAIATVYVTIDAATALTGVRITGLELTDDNGTVMTRGLPTSYIGRVAPPTMRDLGPFAGSVARGERVVLYTGSILDAHDATLYRHRPTRYRMRLVADGNVAIDVAGEVPPLGATG